MDHGVCKKMLPKLTFVLGGAASGKSAWAENLILSSELSPVYVATGQAFDDETKVKINLHKSRRGPEWTLFEATGSLTSTLQQMRLGQSILLDCATMWLTNRMLADGPMDTAPGDFLEELSACKVPMIVVSNEVGQGIVPDNAMAREFREAQGRLNIETAAKADLVVQVVAGLPNILKGTLP